MKNIFSFAVFFCLFLASCNSEPTLQKYFVENTENKNFIALDISSNILNVDEATLTSEQKEALNSFEKINILAFKVNDSNQPQFDSERLKVKTILKDAKYQELMKFDSGNRGASVSFVGDDDHIEEFVLYATQKENGFAVVRVLGKDMNPNSIMTMMSVLKDSKIDLEQLKPLQEMFKK